MKLDKTFLFFLIFFVSNVLAIETNTAPSYTKVYKLLVLYKTKNIVDLEKFDYKNIVLGNDQFAIFSSPNGNLPVNDEAIIPDKYQYTIRFQFVDTPCVGGFLPCFYETFEEEYGKKNYTMGIPKEVVDGGNMDKAEIGKKCLLIFEKFEYTTDSAIWICHYDKKVIIDFATDLSNKIRTYHQQEKEFGLIAKHLEDNINLVDGELVITENSFYFKEKETGIQKLETKWENVAEVVKVLSEIKEELPEWKGDEKQKPEIERCIKIVIGSSDVESMKNNEYFCFYDEKYPEDLSIGNKMAEKFARQINEKLLNKKITDKVKEVFMSPKSSEKEINKSNLILLLNDLKRKIRKSKFVAKKEGKTDAEVLKLIAKEKAELIKNMCLSNQKCEETLDRFAKDYANLQHFADNIDNPYIPLIPKELVNNLGQYLNSKYNINLHGTPSKEDLLSAWKSLRLNKHSYTSMNDFDDKCDALYGVDPSKISIFRMLDLLNYNSNKDLFWQYLPNLQKVQLPN